MRLSHLSDDTSPMDDCRPALRRLEECELSHYGYPGVTTLTQASGRQLQGATGGGFQVGQQTIFRLSTSEPEREYGPKEQSGKQARQADDPRPRTARPNEYDSRSRRPPELYDRHIVPVDAPKATSQPVNRDHNWF
jgi:hypothetical protein